MDRASYSFANNYKILLFVVVLISLFLKFVPYYVTITILLVLFSVLVYFDSSWATDVSALVASWVYLLYCQIYNSFANVTAQPKRVTHPNGSLNLKPPFPMNQMDYIKMKNDMPSPIPREYNLNPSVRAVRNRSDGSPPVVPDYCMNFRDDKLAGPSFSPPRTSKIPKNSILTDITSSYAAHQRYPTHFRNDSRREYHAPSPGNIPLSNNCSQLYDNISSPGFSSRIAQCISEQTSMNSANHQNIGDFPLVHFNQQENKKKLAPSSSQTAAKPRVTVRIAPPVNRSLKKAYNVEQEEKMKSVLEVLKEMSRKRMYSSVDAEEAENCKRLRIHSQSEIPVSRRLPISPKNISTDVTPLGKRIRDSSSDSIDEEVKKKRRQASSISNEIKSSLSSSLTITPPHLFMLNSTKRKATNEISSADKHFKASSVLEQSSETSSEKSSSSSREASPENENYKDESSASSSSSKALNENDEVEITQEISLDKTRGSNLIIKRTKKVHEDTVDSNASLMHDETGVLRLKPVRQPVSIVATPEDKPKKDILRLPKDWEANPRSLQRTPKNPGKMLKKILCAIEGTEDINFDSLPDHVKKLIASVDEIDGPNDTAKKTVTENTIESGIQQKQSVLSNSIDTNKPSTSASSTFTAPPTSASFTFTSSGPKTSSPFSFSASSQLPNPLLSSQR